MGPNDKWRYNNMSEAKYQGRIISALKPYGHILPVESKLKSPGIPDINFFIRNEGWIETKWRYRNTDPEIRQTQFIWFRERMKVNGNAWVLCGTFDKMHYLFPGSAVRWLYKAPWKDWVTQATCSWRTNYIPPIIELLHVIGEINEE